ncbi:MAG: hypothetical protein JWQ98_2137 [Chlorobi bacterium]|nr:hypothetical protein [Chlorobiota bacterium]
MRAIAVEQKPVPEATSARLVQHGQSLADEEHEAPQRSAGNDADAGFSPLQNGVPDQPARAGQSPRFAYDFSRIPVRSAVPAGFQMKSSAPVHQPPCACGGVCPRCRQKEREGVGDGREGSAPFQELKNGTRSGGRSLEPDIATDFGDRLGHDFSGVRIHSDDAAATSARAMSARAYTVGTDIVFGAGEWTPGTSDGRRLLAHELVHVVQQSRGGKWLAPTALTVSRPADSAEREADHVADRVMRPGGVASVIGRSRQAMARKPLDVSKIDQDIIQAANPPAAGTGATPGTGTLPPAAPQPLAPQQGEIAFAANYPGGVAPKAQPAMPVPPADTSAVPVDKTLPVGASFFPSGRPKARERALILGGFHGDERPGWEVLESLVAELSAPAKGSRPLFFHTIVVPRVNAGAIADELGGVHFWRNRCNRQVVDLNRNFPTGGTPKDTDCVNTPGAPIQPEVQGVIDLIKVFKPDRILSTHAISNPKEAGVFADPNTDPAAIELAHGMASTITDDSNRPHNKLTATNFNPIYPKDKPGKVGGGTSLGVYGPTANGGNVPVITIEAPSFGSLGTTGTRSKEAFLRPVRAFLTDPALLDGKADEDILADIDAFTAADRLAFLTGRLPLADKIYERIRLRVETAVAKLNAISPAPPVTVKIISGLRLYSERVSGPTGGSAQAQLVYNKLFLRGSPDTESFPTSFFIGGDRKKGIDSKKWLAEPSANRLAIILKFSSLPGTSRHHWATDVDFNSATSADWAPAASAKGTPGPLFDLGLWLQKNAAKAGFVQAYTAGRKGGYSEEAWHYSYAPIAIGLRQRYNKQVTLSTDVADTFIADMKARAKADGVTVPADLDVAVKALNLSDFVNDIGPGL